MRASFYSHQDVFVSWAMANISSNGSISDLLHPLFLDGVLAGPGLPCLNANFFTYVTIPTSASSQSAHTLRISTHTPASSESNKDDNSYTKRSSSVDNKRHTTYFARHTANGSSNLA